jgi:Flp pilus assembly protein TadB
VILFVVYALALGLVLPSVIKSQYPAETKQIDRINSQITRLDKQKSSQDKVAGDAKKPKATRDAAKAKSKSLDKQITKANDEITSIGKKFQGFVFACYGVLLAVLLLIVAPITALTGQTIGMRFRRVRVVRADGGPVGWAGAFLRFLPPLVLAIFLPSLGAMLGLGMVLWFFRDRNRQGFHDKLAKTLVVAAAAD